MLIAANNYILKDVFDEDNELNVVYMMFIFQENDCSPLKSIKSETVNVSQK